MCEKALLAGVEGVSEIISVKRKAEQMEKSV